jgi:two-component sensor histidine kinase
VALSVADDGVGFPSHVDFRTTSSLDLQLVSTLARQLDATIEQTNGNGTKFCLLFYTLHAANEKEMAR